MASNYIITVHYKFSKDKVVLKVIQICLNLYVKLQEHALADLLEFTKQWMNLCI